MKVVIAGAGIQGSVCARILSQEIFVDKLLVIDNNKSKLEILRKQIDSSKVELQCVDVKNINMLVQMVRGYDVCLDMLLPEYSVTIMKASLAVHTHYLNTAYDMPFWNNIVKGESLFLDKEFKSEGLTALLGCGNSPGLVNVYVKKYCDMLDKIDNISIYGMYRQNFNSPLERWNPGWSTKQAYIDFITNPTIFRNGEFIEKPPFAEIEKKEFMSYGIKEFALHSHEENYSLPYTLGKGISNCEFKYEVDRYAAILYSCGFTYGREVEIGCTKICAAEFLFNLLSQQDLEQAIDAYDEYDDTYSTFINIKGRDFSGEKECSFMLPPLCTHKQEVLKKFGTTKIDVALPAIIGLKCLRNLPKGILFAENIDYEIFIAELNKYIDYMEITEI